MPERIALHVNGRHVEVDRGSTVLAALAVAGVAICRRSVQGEPRGALCGIGVCFECRVTIDGVAHRRSCQILCREAMEVRTDG
ncbi:MAG: (2Fe-2S)-binding protein [bacterium]|nr:(2Fe-2S)-binding protein [bacterium]